VTLGKTNLDEFRAIGLVDAISFYGSSAYPGHPSASRGSRRLGRCGGGALWRGQHGDDTGRLESQPAGFIALTGISAYGAVSLAHDCLASSLDSGRPDAAPSPKYCGV